MRGVYTIKEKKKKKLFWKNCNIKKIYWLYLKPLFDTKSLKVGLGKNINLFMQHKLFFKKKCWVWIRIVWTS